MNRWQDFWIRHLYIVLVLASMLAATAAGAFVLPSSGETYGDQPALAATAIHQVKTYFFNQEQNETLDMYPAQNLGEGTAALMTMPSVSSQDIKEDKKPDDKAGDKAEAGKDTDDKNNEKHEEDNAVHADDEKQTEDDKTDAVSDNTVSADAVDDSDYLDPSWQTVDDTYFDDALFIGDSRTVGFGLYSQLDNVTVFAQKGFQIYTSATKPVVDTVDGRKLTLAEALLERQGEFKKVYIMFGLNEMGWGNAESLDVYFYNLIDYIKETQPDAVIYLQSIIHVSQAIATEKPVFANSAIDIRNERLKNIAATEHIYYIDLNEIFTDDTGSLQPDAASDGIHLKSQYVLVWKEYLKAHAIVR